MTTAIALDHYDRPVTYRPVMGSEATTGFYYHRATDRVLTIGQLADRGLSGHCVTPVVVVAPERPTDRYRARKARDAAAILDRYRVTGPERVRALKGYVRHGRGVAHTPTGRVIIDQP